MRRRQRVATASNMKLIFLLCSVLLAEDAPKPEPQISIEQKLDYQRARANLTEAQRAMNDVVQAMQKVCGQRPVITDTKGDPICGEQPKK